MRRARIYNGRSLAGILTEDEWGYTFVYLDSYLSAATATAISLTMPLSSEPYKSKELFPFFDGLIPEGWLLDIAERNWKIDHRDRMSLLMASCKGCIGTVSVEPIADDEQ